jgi:hypothetical protein
VERREPAVARQRVEVGSRNEDRAPIFASNAALAQ